MIIKFGDYVPDGAPISNGQALAVATNVYPRATGEYGGVNALAAYTNALSSRAMGAITIVDSTFAASNFAGDTSALYKLSTATWGDVSRSAGPYATASTGRWEFAQYGDRVLATNYADYLQSYVSGTSSVFADITAAPKSKAIGVIGNFIVLGNVVDTDGVKLTRVRWSGIDDPTSWEPAGGSTAQTVQSDQQDLPSGIQVQRIIGAVGGADGVVFLETAIYRVQIEGPPTFLGFYEVERARGTPAPGSVVHVGNLAFYLGDDGFYVFDGARSAPIGAGKFDKTFYTDLNQSYYDRISGIADPINNLVMWAYPSAESTDGTPDKIAIYNWTVGRWSVAEIDCEILTRLATSGYTLEQLDSFGTLDALPASLDSRVWAGGQHFLAAFDTTHKAAQFTGDRLSAVIETNEITGDGRMVYVSGVRPIVDTDGVTVSIGYRRRQSSAVTYTTATAVGDDDMCPQHIEARMVRARVTMATATTWTKAVGIEPVYDTDGER